MISPQTQTNAFSIVPTPIGTAIVGPNSDLFLGMLGDISNLTYRAPDGVRIWLENGDMHEFEGPVCVRGTKNYTVTVNTDEGAIRRAFPAVHIFAITPLTGKASLLKMVLQTTLKSRKQSKH